MTKLAARQLFKRTLCVEHLAIVSHHIVSSFTVPICPKYMIWIWLCDFLANKSELKIVFHTESSGFRSCVIAVAVK